MTVIRTKIYAADNWFEPGQGPRYRQFLRYLSASIRSGELSADIQLPPERVLAELAGISRVTVRRAISALAEEGLVEQRRGAGTFVRPQVEKLQQSLSSLVSFSENIRMRGQTPSSRVLERGLFMPSRDEFLILGLTKSSSVARIKRLRFADDMPLAIETSTVPADVIPNPEVVGTSLYEALRARDRAPVRAVQRVTACNLSLKDAELLGLNTGDAALSIQRTAFLPHGRIVELTVGCYRSDMYDFVTELQLEADQ
ncbi:MAG: GntR family transcriptional regulator [Paracoccaceae bacterium]|nr:GntR family transcriptional regulator [Paracoccaceae bacterium]